ncbi:MAG: thioredoxin domain-containing protein [Candidatus Accumulibacter sp.]|uniref:DsbA family protein n=1 Tax=Accumulibacter sp. TaxID=2053492 RepID=UPI00258E92E3|nr:thioredoxin domain-containing protein [Accumulibacter sp.]MCM8623686.1 thioredoxin domain-containing protein [Accumulibacter sp.]
MSAKLVMAGAALALACTFSNAQSSAPTPNGVQVDSKPPVSDASFEVFCDFRCPFCARLFTSLLAGAKAEGREVPFRFRHYPFHEGSDELASFFEAAVANYPDQLEPLIDSLYKFRRQTRPENFRKIVDALSTLHGLDPSRIKRDIQARDTLLAISESKRAAVAAGVDATPTVFYGNTLVTLEEPEEIARFMLDHSRLRAQAPPAAAVGDCPSCERPGRTK